MNRNKEIKIGGHENSAFVKYKSDDQIDYISDNQDDLSDKTYDQTDYQNFVIKKQYNNRKNAFAYIRNLFSTCSVHPENKKN